MAKKKTRQKSKPKQILLCPIIEVAIKDSCGWWYDGYEGEIYKVRKVLGEPYFQTIKPIVRNCEYGLINTNDCEVVG